MPFEQDFLYYILDYFSLFFVFYAWITDQVNVATQELQSRTVASRGILEKLWDLEDAAMLTHEEVEEEYDDDQDEEEEEEDDNENDNKEEKKKKENNSSGHCDSKKRRQRTPKVRPIQDDRSTMELHNDLVHAVEIVLKHLSDELLRTAPV